MKVSVKKLMFVIASLFISNAISAQLNIPDVNIAPGGSAKVSLELNDEAITTYLQMTLYVAVPEGFTIDTTSGAVTERTTQHGADIVYNEDTNLYNLSITNSSGVYISGTSGAIYTFTLKCEESVTNGEYGISLKDATLVYKSGSRSKKLTPEDATFKITVGAAATAEDITLANEWNTYCSTNDLDFAHVKVEVYVVSEVTATSAKLEAVTVVPAGVGFLIKGTAEQKISVPFAESAGSVTSKLVGVTTDTTLDGGNYVLSGDQFVLCSEGGTLPAHKAYLPGGLVTSGAKAFGFDFGDATGINEAKAAKADGAIYSISGVRVAQPQKGVYIMNGRKVIVK